MIFAAALSKFGKGSHLSAYMPNKDQIKILYFLKAVEKKVVKTEGNMRLEREPLSLGYSQAIWLGEDFLLTRIDKNLGIQSMGNLVSKNAKIMLNNMKNDLKMARIAQKTEKSYYKGE